MVAVVAGKGLGLFDTSLNTLGGAGVWGQGGFGQAGGQALVNASNGNLVLRFTDQQLSGLGLDLPHTRTYNTQGAYSDADGDGWRWDGERRVALDGALNSAGSSLVRTTGDGHETRYAWTGSRYQSSEGDGAHDSLSWDAASGEWLWTDGSRRTQERYAGATGRLVRVTDASGTQIDYGYDGNGRLNSVLDSSGQALVLVYNAAGQLARLDTQSSVGGALSQRVYYSYDASGRLSQVRTDLSPADNSIADGQVYSTSYSYDGASFRIAGVSQSDGSAVAFTYVLVGGEYRVRTVSDAAGTTTFGYDTANRRTDVSNGLNQLWSYSYDAAGQLTQVQSPAVNGPRLVTGYSYDADGNLTQVTDGRGNAVTYGYDASGNRVLERDALGTTRAWVYNSANQLLNEIRYSQAATWDSVAGRWNEPPAASAQVTRYAYDSDNRLRYSVDASGAVREYRYNGAGLLSQELGYADLAYSVGALAPSAGLSEATLTSWAAARDKSRSSLTELSYDYRGNLSRRVTYASVDASGAGVLDAAAQVNDYIYSEHGRLLQTLVVRGAGRTDKTTLGSVAYDGLGRVLSQVEASGTRTYAYNGVGRTLAVTSSAGLTQTQAFDAQGRLLSLSESGAGIATRLTQYRYDAAGRLTMVQDATGVRRYTLYDAAGRVSAQVDGSGALTEYLYDGAGQKTQEIRYTTLVNTSTWYDGTTVLKTLVSQVRPAATAADRSSTYTYDDAGRLSASTDAAGFVSTYSYDGRGQLIQVQNGERITRTFYDAAGRQSGELDGEGYLRKHYYDAAGRLYRTVRFTTVTDPAQRASGSLAQLIPSGSSFLQTRYYHDAAGRQIGHVDEQQFVTATLYDEAGNRQQSVRYATPYTAPIGVVDQRFDVLTTALASSARQTSTTQYDGFGRVSQRIEPDGSVTAYLYDTAGRLVQEIRAQGTGEARSTRTRYDVLGQALGRLTGEGAARVTAGMSEAQIQGVYAGYGLTYSYDVAGRQLSVRDAAGNRTLAYYDGAGRQTHSINALGEVSETLYNAFGEMEAQTRFIDRLSGATTAGLSGGLLTTPLSALTQAMRDNVANSSTRQAYDLRGQRIGSTDAVGYLSTYGYNRHGEQTRISRTITKDATPQTITTALSYNQRGELIGRTEDVDGLARSTAIAYDAFGRVISRTDGRGLVSTTAYASNGRIITQKNPLNQSETTEYDAFARVLTQTDALGQVTAYAYDDLNRTLTVTTPDGVSVSTLKNRHGQTLTVTDGTGAVTRYSYDLDGQLLTTQDALNHTSTHAYDNAGRLFSVSDALGRATTYGYDAANRVVSRTDANAVITRYAFDGQGRQVRVTEAEGLAEQRITDYGYDRQGQLLSVTQDPTGLKLTTTYAYDGLGQQVQVARGTLASPNQQVTEYRFDTLGRRIEERQDPSGLNLLTQYRYNGNDQVSRKINAAGTSTWYVYDSAGRLTDTVDALGGITRSVYDAAGRVSSTIRYATRLAAATVAAFGDALVSVSPSANAAIDQKTSFIYDPQGRVRYSVDALNQVSETRYDANGRVLERRQYDKAIAAATPRTLADIATALLTAGAQARTTSYVYDAVGQLKSVTDALGKVERYGYDALGNRTSLTDKSGAIWSYSYDALNRQVLTTSPGWYNKITGQYQLASDGTANTFQVTTEQVYDAVGNAVRSIVRIDNTGNPWLDYLNSFKVYDRLGRVTHAIDALNGVTAYGYDSLGNLTSTKRHANALTVLPANAQYYVSGDITAQALVADAAQDRTTTHVYDKAGRLSSVTDAAGKVERYGYDALGNRTSLTDKNGAVWTSTYDRLNRLVEEISPLLSLSSTAANGAVVSGSYYRVTLLGYDALGNLISRSEGRLRAAPGNAASSDDLSQARTTTYGYDAVGRQVLTTAPGWYNKATGRYQAASDGTANTFQVTTEQVYDAVGNAVRTTVWINNTGNPWVDFLNSFQVYDRLGRVTHAIDRLSGVTAYGYDSQGNLISTTRHANKLTVLPANGQYYVSGDITAQALVTDAAQDRKTTNVYDKAGRLSSVTDAAGKVERYGYDALGNRKTLTNKNGHVWTYSYDRLNRLTEEISPALYVASIDANGSVTAKTTRAVTLLTYDAAGNVLSRQEGRLRLAVTDPASSDDLSQARTTTYAYDAVGRQVLTTTPGWYNKATGAYQQSSDGTANSFQVSTEVTYDAAGNAVRNRVRVNNTGVTATDFVDSFKVYDGLGRVSHDIDALNGVTAYRYDSLGNAISTTRHANGLSAALPARGYYLAGDITGTSLIADAALDRTLISAYDKAGRKVSVQQDQVGIYSFTGNVASSTLITAAPTTLYRYDSLGQLVRETQVGRNAATGATVITGASTVHYYDQAGNRLGSVDALGHYTRREYDGLGQLSRQVEYATALTSWSEASLPASPVASGLDRSTLYSYDALGRMTQTTRENVLYWAQDASNLNGVVTASQVLGNLIESRLSYDNVGNLKTVTDALGNVTTTDYNALGQVLKVTEPARWTAKAGAVNPFAGDFSGLMMASPTTSYLLNAFGQAVREIRAAGKDAAGNTQQGVTQTSRTLYDAAGYEVQEIDANGSAQTYKVDVAGRRLEESRQVNVTLNAWTTVFGVPMSMNQVIRRSFEYDKLGQQTATLDSYTQGWDTPMSTRDSVVYNRFGEVTQKLLNGSIVELYNYDQVGRVESHASANSTATVFNYDLSGKVSRSTVLGDWGTAADDRITYARNDLLGRTLEQHLPAFEANINADTLNNVNLTLTTPIIRQSHDRWGNVLSRTDARGQITWYSYNHNNQLLDEVLPATDILRENGSSYRANLMHRRGYDAVGNLIQEQDYLLPYTGVSTYTLLRSRQHVYNQAGELSRDIDALGATRAYLTDAHGNRVGTKNAVGVVTLEGYDAMDRHTSHGILRNGAKVTLLTNQYDQAGRLYGEISGSTAVEETLASVANGDWSSTTSGVMGNTKYTVYNERGNITWTRNESGVAKSFEYDTANRKTSERDGLGNTLTWTYSAGDFSRLTSRKDLAGRVFTYTYNAFGQVEKETLGLGGINTIDPSGLRPDKTHSYYANGLLKSITEGHTYNSDTTEATSSYNYDLAGNKVYQANTQRWTLYGTNPSYDSFNTYYNETRYSFDEIGRLKGIKVPAGTAMVSDSHRDEPWGYWPWTATTARIDALTYQYDEYGNRRRIYLDTTNQYGNRELIDDWYKYDLEDRVLVAEGYNNGSGQVVAGNLGTMRKGQALSYDAAGRRQTSEQWLNTSSPSEFYQRSEYIYNDLGQVLGINTRQITRALGSNTTQATTSVGAATSLLSSTYDTRGNRLSQTDYNSSGVASTRTDYSYRGDGQAASQFTYNIGSGLLTQANYFNEANMFDAVGNQIAYRYAIYNASGSLNYTGDTFKAYTPFDDYKESSIRATISIPSKSGLTTLYHSDRGELLQARITGNSPSVRMFASNREGQLIARVTGNGSTGETKAQSYLYYQGAALASFGNLSAAEITDTFTPISADYPGRTPGSYVVNEGDTLAGVAQAVWGDSNMWYLIADANGLDPSLPLTAGDSLKIPNVVSSTHNDATTFKPYNPDDVIGNITPAAKPTPPKPKKKKSGGLSSIVTIIVTIVASVFTAGAALAAMIGSIAGQLVGKATGEVDKFSWRQVAVAGITAGITAGVGELAGSLGGWAQGASEVLSGTATDPSTWQVASAYAAKGVVDYAANQVANRVVGLDTSFSWRGVAATAAGSGLGGAMGVSKLADSGWPGRALNDQFSAAVSATMSDKWFGGGRPDYGQVAVDAFGNTLASWTLAKIESSEADRVKQEQEQLDRWTEGELARAGARVDANRLEQEQARLGLWTEGELARAGARMEDVETFAVPRSKPLDSVMEYYTYDVYPELTNGTGKGTASIAREYAAFPRMDWSPELNLSSLGGYAPLALNGYDDSVPILDSSGTPLDSPYPRETKQDWSVINLYDRHAIVPREPANGDLGHDFLAGLSNVSNIPLNLGGVLLGSFAGVMSSTGADQLLDPLMGLPGLAPEARAAKWMLSSLTERAAARAEAGLASVGAKGAGSTSSVFGRRAAGEVDPSPFSLATAWTASEGSYSGRLAEIYKQGSITYNGKNSSVAGDFTRNIRLVVATNTNSAGMLNQIGGINGMRFARTEGLGTHASIADLRATGALPGEQGVIITDRTVRFGDVYELGVLDGRKVEFSLVTEYVDGALVKKLYSGDAWTTPVPRDARLIGHVHPNENAFQLWPSAQDMNMVNARHFRSLQLNPNTSPIPSRIFWGPGNADNTIFYPGFGKSPALGQ